MDSGLCCGRSGFDDAVEVVMVGQGDRSQTGGDGVGDDFGRLVRSVGSGAVQMEVDGHLESDRDTQGVIVALPEDLGGEKNNESEYDGVDQKCSDPLKRLLAPSLY